MKTWAVVSSLVAPVAMIGGWTLAAALQPNFDSLRQTISELAGYGARDRWVMTCGLVLLGVCHVVTAAGLTGIRPLGRLLLALGGVAIGVVAALPVPAHGPSTAHGVFAYLGFAALAVWPLAGTQGASALSSVATVVLLGLLLVALLHVGGPAYVGLVERLLAGAESLCPAVFVLSTRNR